MAGNSNLNIVRKAFKQFEEDIDKEVLRETEVFAQNLVYYAIQQRRKARGKHDYTGNLLNSIVSAVYKDKELKTAFFSGETGIKEPYYYKMTASHGAYYFSFRDYEGVRGSTYTPTIETFRQKGLDDAYDFISTYSPDMNGYVVVLAYTTEYADWVEMQRHTTGYLSTFKYANRVATKLYPIKK